MTPYIHKKTDNLYWVTERFKFKLPIIGIWIGFVKYRSEKDNALYCRLERDFNKNFYEVKSFL